MNAVCYAAEYDPETDFDRWYTLFSARRITRRLGAGRVLEVGSATGALTALLASPTRQFTCVERAATYVTRARARALPGVTIVHGTIEAFTASQPFDHVLAINVLHELAEPAAVLRRLAGLLAPGGTLHVTLPNPNSLHRLSALGSAMIPDLCALSERGRRLHTRRLQPPDEVRDAFAVHGLHETSREAIMVKPLPNAAMAQLSDELIEAYDALAAALPEHGALTYSVFVRA